MAYTKIAMTNGIEIKMAPIGFSWTTFFFGGIPALFRQDWIWGICMIIGNLLLYGFVGIIWSFFYNKMYVKGLFAKGYHVHALPPDLTEDGLRNYLGFVMLPGGKTGFTFTCQSGTLGILKTSKIY